MTNADIRRRAYTLFWKHKGLLLAAMAVWQLPTLPTQLLPSPWNQVASIPLYIGLYPVFLGIWDVMLGLSGGRPGRLRDIFRYYRRADWVKSALLLGALMRAIVFVFLNLPQLLTSIPGLPAPLRMLLGMLGFALTIVYMLFTLRVILAPYYFCREPGAGAVKALRSSLRDMRGHAADLFIFSLSVMWPWLLGTLVLLFLAINASLKSGFDLIHSRLYLPGIFVVALPGMALVQLAFACYARERFAPPPKKDRV